MLLKLATEVLLGGTERHNTVIAVLATLVVVLLAPLVKNAIQTTLDRAYYRDRYDYRRALVGFARDLNSDLDLERLSARLVERVTRDAGARAHGAADRPGDGRPRVGAGARGRLRPAVTRCGWSTPAASAGGWPPDTP